MSTIRVTTWNVLWRDRMKRLPILVDHLRAVSPDIVLLQETDETHAAAVADALEMTVAAVKGNGSTVSVPAVLTRIVPIDAETIDLPDLESDPQPRLATATIPALGQRVRFTSAHLRHTHRAGRLALDDDYREVSRARTGLDSITDATIRQSVQIRLEQLAIVQSLVPGWQSQPQVFAGDFNFIPDGLEYRRIIGWGLADAWRAAPRLGSGATVLERNPLVADGVRAYEDSAITLMPGHDAQLDYTLDYQFHSPELRPGPAWTVGGVRAGDAWPSDHLGIVVDYAREEK